MARGMSEITENEDVEKRVIKELLSYVKTVSTAAKEEPDSVTQEKVEEILLRGLKDQTKDAL